MARKSKGTVSNPDQVEAHINPMGRVTLVKNKRVNKQEQSVLGSNSLEWEDGFSDLYYDPNTGKGEIIAPPFSLDYLAYYAQHNNALSQLIAAMEVNIDGTGYDIEHIDGDDSEAVEQAEEQVKQFFDEAFPGISFTTIRRRLRRDLETFGMGFLEVLRSAAGDLMFVNFIDAKSMRLLRLDAPVPVEKTVLRMGKQMTITMNMRERRFVQKVGSNLVYFKEFGASRDLDKVTGKWANGKLPANQKASEILFFTVQRDVFTPYGVPRWINQVPSVLGSRKAEELNLDFFNAGGLPPALVMVNGGVLAAETRKALEAYLSGKGSSRHRAAIVEAYSTSGSLEGSGGTVRVAVERFGAERQQDSMFENYDSKCESRVRSSFRLPPLFVGKADDYSFATAYASYIVAEAQVFVPEREEFDEIINVTIMKELAPGFLFRSLPLSINDSSVQLNGATLLAAQKAITKGQLVEAVNLITGLNAKVPNGTEEEIVGGSTPEVQADGPVGDTVPPGSPANGDPGEPQPGKPPVQKVSKGLTLNLSDLTDLASDWAQAATGGKHFSKFHISTMRETIKALEPSQLAIFEQVLSTMLMPSHDHDAEGAADLCGCASDILLP